jgi:signal transduction histidine kinase
MTRSLLYFPWPGVLASISYILMLIVATDPQRTWYLDESLLVWLRSYDNRLLLFAIVLILLVVDFIRFRKAGRARDMKLKKLKAQLDEFFESKNALQNKAQKYSGHADKLKLFISDRLLEYIEYDEKFLHFKSIASEVRHNGVICYDQVTSLLKQALEQKPEMEDRQRYQDALNSMLYLWDLLDLSTTDNIAMYVANKLYQCEELYYRKVLDEDTDEAPSALLFPARRAAVRALRGFVEEDEQLSTEQLVEGETFCYEDERFWVQLEDAGNLLGNENHVLLIIENMINNGLYYASQKKYHNRYAKLSLQVEKDAGNVVFRVYNPGPAIGDDVRDKIYQLGYSTKRSRDNQGKGLGLYFVKQLVNGYEGSIDFRNVCNREDTCVLRIECESGTLINRIIEIAVNDKGKPVCRTEHGGVEKELRFSVPERIRSLEVSRQAGKQTHVFTEFDSKGKTRILDPAHRDHPVWCMDVVESVSSTEIVFKPLDTVGVEFTIRIPTAESRLDPEYHDAAQQSTAQFDPLNENFRAVSKLIED